MLFVDSCSILRWFVNFFMPNNCKNSIVESGYKDLTPLKSGLGAGSVEHAPPVVEHAPNMLKAQLPSPALQKERSAASQETPFPHPQMCRLFASCQCGPHKHTGFQTAFGRPGHALSRGASEPTSSTPGSSDMRQKETHRSPWAHWLQADSAARTTKDRPPS